MNAAVFDLETNGMAGASVLSASSIVFEEDGSILDVFNRFYFPAERPAPYALEVHGLTLGRLTALRRRAGVMYSPYFAEDWPSLLEFWEDWDVGGVVVHNLSFDAAFLPEIAQSAVRWWCSMKGLTSYCAIPKRSGRGAKAAYKWPKLGEAADIVCNGPNALTPPDATALAEEAAGGGAPHVSLFDCFELYRVVSRIFLHHKTLVKFGQFATRFVPPPAPSRRSGAALPSPHEDPFVLDILAYESKIRQAYNFISN